MECVLNETTKTVHKRELGAAALQAECGVTYHLEPDQLRETSVARATTDFDAQKCGRCFDEGGGY